jgi:hypothetical protein
MESEVVFATLKKCTLNSLLGHQFTSYTGPDYTTILSHNSSKYYWGLGTEGSLNISPDTTNFSVTLRGTIAVGTHTFRSSKVLISKVKKFGNDPEDMKKGI